MNVCCIEFYLERKINLKKKKEIEEWGVIIFYWLFKVVVLKEIWIEIELICVLIVVV